MKHFGLMLLLCLAQAVHAGEPLKFGVANQRPVMLTAQIWNPILAYVSKKSGVNLALSMGKTATETTELATNGELDFIYTNTLFTPERGKLGFHAIARLNTDPVRGLIVVPEESPIKHLGDLAGKTIASPTAESFISYALQMRALHRANIKSEVIFTGSQEGGIRQMFARQVDAAAVHSAVIQSFSEREGLRYRAIYTSEPYLDLPVMAHPRVPASTVVKVRAALLGMSKDPEGLKILENANSIIKADAPLAFITVKDRDYDNYRNFYLNAHDRAQK